MVKREHTSDLEEAEEDLLSPPPSDASLPKKSKSADSSSIYESKPTPPSRSNMAKVKSESGSPGKRKGAWSKDELQHLYAIMCPKRTGVKWDEVADQIPGRGVKACQHKWHRMQGKIVEAIGAMGE